MSEACTVFKGLLFLSLFVALIFKNQNISYHPFLYFTLLKKQIVFSCG